MREWFAPSELAGLPGLPGTIRAIQIKGKKEGWESRKRAGRGGGAEYRVGSLPAETRAHIANQNVQSIMAQHSDQVEPEIVPGAKSSEELAEDAAEKARTIQLSMAEFSRIPAGDPRKVTANARLWVLKALGAFIQQHNCSRDAAYHALARSIAMHEIPVPAWVWDQMPKYRGQKSLSPATIALWDKSFRSEGIMALTNKHGNRSGQSIIETNEGLFRLVLGAMIKAPQITGKAMIDFIEATNKHRAPTGEPALPVPCQRSFERFRNRWIEENKQVWTMITNPDRWKNVFMSAAGFSDEGIDRPNQLWELDSTPADWMLTDGRHSVVGVIDVGTRRLKYHVSKTSRAMAVCQVHRRAMLAWGVPEAVRTDNGKDYVSEQYDTVLDGLDIPHLVCIPFASEQKPFIERSMRTMSHGILNLLPGFVGHNVAERKQIEARKSFADRMMTRGELVEVEMSAEDLQRHLDNWCEHYYGNEKHSALGMSPNEKARSYTGHIQRITDERALDMLLCEVGGVRRIGKQGIRYDNHTYINDDMGQHIGQFALLKHDEADIGRLYAYVEDRFIGVYECPEITGISRREAAAAIKSKQKRKVAEQAQELRQFAKEIKTNIAETVLEHRIELSENIVAMPHRSEAHTTIGLQEAARAARSGEAASKPLSEREQEEFERLNADDQEAAREPATVSELLEFGDDPIRNYRICQSLQAREARGETLKPREQAMLKAYVRSSEYTAMKKFNEAE